MVTSKSHHILSITTRVVADACGFLAAFVLAMCLTRPGQAAWLSHAQAHLPYLATLASVWTVIAADQRLFVSRRSETLVELLFTTAKALFSSVLFAVFVMALLTSIRIDRTFLLIFAFLAIVAMLIVRMGMRLSLWNLRRRGYNSRRILVVGSNQRSARLATLLLANEQYGYHVEGFLEDDAEQSRHLLDLGIPGMGAVDGLEDILANRVIDGVYVALPVRSFYGKIRDIARLCEGVGVPVRFVADLFPVSLASSSTTLFPGVPMLSLTFEPGLHSRFALRRAVDIVTSCALLVMLSPVFLLIAVLIKLDSRGPVFVSGKFAGQDGRSFRLLAFRTRIAAGNDDGETPLTRFGRLVQRYGLEELPQVCNVLLGQVHVAGTPASGGPRTAMGRPD